MSRWASDGLPAAAIHAKQTQIRYTVWWMATLDCVPSPSKQMIAFYFVLSLISLFTFWMSVHGWLSLSGSRLIDLWVNRCWSEPCNLLFNTVECLSGRIQKPGGWHVNLFFSLSFCTFGFCSLYVYFPSFFVKRLWVSREVLYKNYIILKRLHICTIKFKIKSLFVVTSHFLHHECQTTSDMSHYRMTEVIWGN